MPSRSRPAGPLRADLDDINTRIRQLMNQPASQERTQQYHDLLAEWRDLTTDDVEPAA